MFNYFKNVFMQFYFSEISSFWKKKPFSKNPDRQKIAPNKLVIKYFKFDHPFSIYITGSLNGKQQSGPYAHFFHQCNKIRVSSEDKISFISRNASNLQDKLN